MSNFIKILSAIILVILSSALSFGITCALVYGVCWAFGFQFSIKIAFGIWLVLTILRSIFS